MPRTNDLGVAAYNAAHGTSPLTLPLTDGQNCGRSRGTPPSGTLSLRPRTSGGDRGLRGVARRVLGRVS